MLVNGFTTCPASSSSLWARAPGETTAQTNAKATACARISTSRRARSRAPFGNEALRSTCRLKASVDAEARNPNEVVAAEQERQALALPGRHARLLEEILERAARTARIGLEALATSAKAHAQRLVLERDAFAARLAKAQLAAERWQPEQGFAFPFLPGELRRRIGIEKHFASVHPQPCAVVLDQRARAAGGELLQH